MALTAFHVSFVLVAGYSSKTCTNRLYHLIYTLSVLASFYYGNITHPSADPPRIGFLSTVPGDAAARLRAAVSRDEKKPSPGGWFRSIVRSRSPLTCVSGRDPAISATAHPDTHIGKASGTGGVHADAATGAEH